MSVLHDGVPIGFDRYVHVPIGVYIRCKCNRFTFRSPPTVSTSKDMGERTYCSRADIKPFRFDILLRGTSVRGHPFINYSRVDTLQLIFFIGVLFPMDLHFERSEFKFAYTPSSLSWKSAYLD
jgi:hypothetical protein